MASSVAEAESDVAAVVGVLVGLAAIAGLVGVVRRRKAAEQSTEPTRSQAGAARAAQPVTYTTATQRSRDMVRGAAEGAARYGAAGAVLGPAGVAIGAVIGWIAGSGADLGGGQSKTWTSTSRAERARDDAGLPSTDLWAEWMQQLLLAVAFDGQIAIRDNGQIGIIWEHRFETRPDDGPWTPTWQAWHYWAGSPRLGVRSPVPPDYPYPEAGTLLAQRPFIDGRGDHLGRASGPRRHTWFHRYGRPLGDELAEWTIRMTGAQLQARQDLVALHGAWLAEQLGLEVS